MNLLAALSTLPSVFTPPDWGTLFGGVGDTINTDITSVLPVAIPVLVTLAGVSIALSVFRKFGVKR